jgi:type IV pilus assembly protein PilX
MHRGQRGVVLIIALVMMITITFAGLALFRQVGLGAVIVGNLAFKQGATSAADRGVEAARNWLTSPTLASIARLQGQAPPGWTAITRPLLYLDRRLGHQGTDSSCLNRDETATRPSIR